MKPPPPIAVPRVFVATMTMVLVPFAALFVVWLGAAMAHEPYTDWRQPDQPTLSCCNGDDCRPTRAYMHDDGRWRAWNGYMWLVVPWERVLPTDYAGDGRSHLCEKGTTIYCFSPGQVRG